MRIVHRSSLIVLSLLIVCCVPSASLRAQECNTDGLISWFEFENGSVHDSCGQNDGFNWGASADTTNYGPVSQEGEFLTSIRFDGESSHVRMFDMSGIENLAFSIWVNYEQVDREVAVFSGEGGDWDRGLHITENGELDIHLGRIPSFTHYVLPNFQMPEDRWVNIVLEYLSDDVRISINGSLRWAFGQAAGPHDDTSWDIGSAPVGDHDLLNFKGRIDELLIYGEPLAADHIQVIYEAGLSNYYGGTAADATSMSVVKSMYR